MNTNYLIGHRRFLCGVLGSMAVVLGTALPATAKAEELPLSVEVVNRGAVVGEVQQIRAAVTNNGTTNRTLKACGYYIALSWSLEATDPTTRAPDPVQQPGSQWAGTCIELGEVTPGQQRPFGLSLKGLRSRTSTTVWVRVYDTTTGTRLGNQSRQTVIRPRQSLLTLSPVTIVGSTRNVGVERSVRTTVTNTGTVPVSPKVCATYSSNLWSLTRSEPTSSGEESRPGSTTRACMVVAAIEPGKSTQLTWVLVGREAVPNTTITVEAFADSDTAVVKRSATTSIQAPSVPPSLSAQVSPLGSVSFGAELTVTANLSGSVGSQAARRSCVTFATTPWVLTSSDAGSQNTSSGGLSANCSSLQSLPTGGSRTLTWKLRAAQAPSKATPIIVGVYEGRRRVAATRFPITIQQPRPPKPEPPEPAVSWNTSPKGRIITATLTPAAKSTVSLLARKGRAVRKGKCVARKPSGATRCAVRLKRGRWKLTLKTVGPDGSIASSRRTVRIR